MRYSIIIPVFNGAATLKAAVESALALPDREILLINDGSTDDSGEICREFAEKYPDIRVFHQENRGVSAARNLGLEMAKGDRILFLDADDIMNASVLKELPEADCLIFGGQAGSPEELFTGNLLSPVWNKVFRREIIEGGDLRFREEMFVYEDLDFSLRYLSLCEGVMVFRQSLCCHRPSGKALSRMGRLESLEQILGPIGESLAPESEILPKLAEILAREMLAAKPGRILKIRRELRVLCPEANLLRIFRGALAMRWKK